MMMGGKKSMHTLTFLLVMVGGLNWLVFGIFQTDLGSWIGGMGSMVARVVYVLVGLAAVYEIATHKTRCKACAEMMQKKPMGPGSTPSQM